MSPSVKMYYTFADEAPALATYSLFPLLEKTLALFDIHLELKSISLASRVLMALSEYLPDHQKIPDDLNFLQDLVNTPSCCLIKLPNISASLSQLKECVSELQSLGFKIPSYPEKAESPEDLKLKQCFDSTLGSAVNPKLRVGNSDRKIPTPVKDYAMRYPHSMGKWIMESGCHVSSMKHGDFYDSEKSISLPSDDTLQIIFEPDQGEQRVLKEIAVNRDDVIDGSFFSVKAFEEFIQKEKIDAQQKGVIFSLHLKATMMKVSDPVIFGHALKAYLPEFFTKYSDIFAELSVDPRQGLGDLLIKITGHPAESAIRHDLEHSLNQGPEIAMVNSDKGITNFHVPSDMIIDASMAALIRGGGKLWNKDGKPKNAKAVIPDRSYADLYQETIKFCRYFGEFNPKTMGSVANLGLMAYKAEEYGSHPTTFVSDTKGTYKVVAKESHKVLMSHQVEQGDIWRLCHTKDEAIKDWFQCALSKTKANQANPNNKSHTVFWLNIKRAHDHVLIVKLSDFLSHHQDMDEVTIEEPAEAAKTTLFRMQRGLNTLTVTGNVLRDYITDLFPILELGTSAKMLSVVSLIQGGRIFETGSGGSAPKHVEQMTKENHLRWDSLGEFLALQEALNHLAEHHQDQPDLADLTSAVTQATEEYLKKGWSPSRVCHERDTRGSHFLWFLALTKALASGENRHNKLWQKVYQELEVNKELILQELLAVQGKPITTQELGGYYYLEPNKASTFMRPSQTFNRILDQLPTH
ncbi:MAG: NADP-dependent isocitrate dehydrogenase [Proteobacteria bacterium]|nr:NADP-dependent isocitrate dehydrogenase [Pseudomonadota bacterium]